MGVSEKWPIGTTYLSIYLSYKLNSTTGSI
jgi:hypothetical protein